MALLGHPRHKTRQYLSITVDKDSSDTPGPSEGGGGALLAGVFGGAGVGVLAILAVVLVRGRQGCLSLQVCQLIISLLRLKYYYSS